MGTPRLPLKTPPPPLKNGVDIMTNSSHNMTTGYRIAYSRAATRYMSRLSRPDRERLMTALERISENPDRRDLDIKPLVDRRGYRLRLGRLRVLFRRDDEARSVFVELVGPRGRAYKKR